MTLEQFANIGELLGGIAVVASLVYLAVQIRQNTQTVKSATLLQNSELWSSVLPRMASNEFVEAFIEGASGRPDISPKSYAQFAMLGRVFFIACENQYYQYSHGSLDKAIYQGYERAIQTQVLNQRGFRIHWQQARYLYSPAFVAHIDEMIANNPEEPLGAGREQWKRIAEDWPTLNSASS